MSRRWYEDSWGLRPWVAVTGLLLVLALLFAGTLGFSMYASESACEQRALSRPDIPVEWHWNTGCILLRPDSTVVVSS